MRRVKGGAPPTPAPTVNSRSNTCLPSPSFPSTISTQPRSLVHGPGAGSMRKSAETRGRRVWTSPCYRAASGTYVADISQPDQSKHDNTKQQPSVHPRTQEHMESQLHQHFATHIDPSCRLHKAANHIFCWIGPIKTMVPKKPQKCRNTGPPCLGKGGGATLRYVMLRCITFSTEKTVVRKTTVTRGSPCVDQAGLAQGWGAGGYKAGYSTPHTFGASSTPSFP